MQKTELETAREAAAEAREAEARAQGAMQALTAKHVDLQERLVASQQDCLALASVVQHLTALSEQAAHSLLVSPFLSTLPHRFFDPCPTRTLCCSCCCAKSGQAMGGHLRPFVSV